MAPALARYTTVHRLSKRSGARPLLIRQKIEKGEIPGAIRDVTHPKKRYLIPEKSAEEFENAWKKRVERLERELEKAKERGLILLSKLSLDLGLQPRSLKILRAKNGVKRRELEIILLAGKLWVTPKEYAREISERYKDGRVSTGVAARVLGVSDTSIQEFEQNGELTCKRIGRGRYFELTDIIRLKNRRHARKTTKRAKAVRKQDHALASTFKVEDISDPQFQALLAILGPDEAKVAWVQHLKIRKAEVSRKRVKGKMGSPIKRIFPED